MIFVCKPTLNKTSYVLCLRYNDKKLHNMSSKCVAKQKETINKYPWPLKDTYMSDLYHTFGISFVSRYI